MSGYAFEGLGLLQGPALHGEQVQVASLSCMLLYLGQVLGHQKCVGIAELR